MVSSRYTHEHGRPCHLGTFAPPCFLEGRGFLLLITMSRRTTEEDAKAQKGRYLRAFSMTGTLTAGCKAARVSPGTVYQWREMDDEFVLQERQAKDAFADALEIECVRRAWHGTKKPVYQQGTLVGHVQEFSDTLLIFALKAIRPEKYRDRFDVTTGGQPMIKQVDADLAAVL